MKHTSRIRLQGLTLVEVLVTLLISTIGLMGLMALQIKSLQMNTSAYYRSQASILISDIVDRMRLNKSQNYSISLGNGAPQAVTGSSLTAANVTTNDQNQWLSRIASVLPSGDGEIDCPDMVASCKITVQWSEGGQTQSLVFQF